MIGSVTSNVEQIKQAAAELYNNLAPDAQTVGKLGLGLYGLSQMPGVAGQDAELNPNNSTHFGAPFYIGVSIAGGVLLGCAWLVASCAIYKNCCVKRPKEFVMAGEGNSLLTNKRETALNCDDDTEATTLSETTPSGITQPQPLPQTPTKGMGRGRGTPISGSPHK
jgi:hypothetical protein